MYHLATKHSEKTNCPNYFAVWNMAKRVKNVCGTLYHQWHTLEY